jgi:hypothetical protein
MNSPISIRRRVPPLGPNPDYSSALYCDPPSHDFCVWLIIAELMRRYHGAREPLKVRFALRDGMLGYLDFGPYSLREAYRASPLELDRLYSDQMMANVLRPAIEMIGAIEQPAIELPCGIGDLIRHVEYDYHIGHLVDAGRQGHVMPQWQPPQWAHDEVSQFLDGRKPVVITLREPSLQPERNSNLTAWLRFAAEIEPEHPILFVRDTARANEPLPFATWPRASTNAYVRAALYQHALVNMLVCNGPAVWCMFSDAPYLMFKQLVPALSHWQHGQAQGWKEQDHIEVGDQYPWATPRQRMTWTDDTFENIMSAFEAWKFDAGGARERLRNSLGLTSLSQGLAKAVSS